MEPEAISRRALKREAVNQLCLFTDPRISIFLPQRLTCGIFPSFWNI